MRQFRKKPIVIEAIQFFDQPEEIIAIQEFMGNTDLTIDYADVDDLKLKIETLEGIMDASLGDWIIKGVKGEFYPCKPDVFDKSYNEVLSESLTFGEAIEAAKSGHKIARKGWNGAGMFAYIVPANSYPAQTGVAKSHFGENAMVPYRAYWALKTAQEDVTAWAPSGSDSLAEDWMILN